MRNIALMTFVLLLTSTSQSEDFGLGLVTVVTPHYMGADQYYPLAFPIPLFSSMLEQEKKKSGFILDVDADLNLPLSGSGLGDSGGGEDLSFKNYARRGMGFTPAALYLGAKTGYRLGGLELTVSVTPGLQLGQNWDGAGVQSRAEINLNVSRFGSWEVILVGNAQFTDETYNQLYYGVDATDAINGRPAYEAESGYLGATAGLHVRTWRPIKHMFFGFFVEYQDMNGSVVEDSPLVIKKQNVLGGGGFGYFF